MFRIVHLPANIDDLTLALIRHKTWITVDDRQYESKLLNQYDLAEVIEGAHEALTPDQRRRAYRHWLWEQMQHEHGVVWRELCDLADAYEADREIVITVHAAAVHADIITSAVEWMAANTESVHLPERKFRNNAVPFDYTGIDMPNERWPAYDPDDPDTARSAFDPNRVCFIVGHEQMLLGYRYNMDALQTALVVGFGMVKLGRETTRLRPFTGKLKPDWVAAISAMLHDLAPDAVPLRLDVRSSGTTHEDIRYAPWRPDSLVPDETNVTPFNHSQVIGRSLPEVKWRSQKRPYFLHRAQGDNVRPILRWHKANTRPPCVLDPEQQANGRFQSWRKAERSDWEQLHAA